MYIHVKTLQEKALLLLSEGDTFSVGPEGKSHGEWRVVSISHGFHSRLSWGEKSYYFTVIEYVPVNFRGTARADSPSRFTKIITEV